jgi:hypothetical protein
MQWFWKSIRIKILFDQRFPIELVLYDFSRTMRKRKSPINTITELPASVKVLRVKNIREMPASMIMKEIMYIMTFTLSVSIICSQF